MPTDSAAGADTDRPYWDMAMEPLFGSERMRLVQLDRLRQRVDDLWEHAPYFRRRMQATGFAPGDLKSLADWSAATPVFTKADYRALMDECGNDVYRMLDETLPVPVGQLVTMAATSGTTGDPQPYPLTETDIQDLWGEFMLRARWRSGLRAGDRVAHGFALSMFLAGVPVLQCTRDGVMQIPIGAESGAAHLLKMARFFRATALMCTPSLAEHLIERGPELLGTPDGVGSLGIRTVICGGEPGAGIPEVRARIESAYGARLFDAGAGLGISCAHPEYQGMHWVGEDLCLYELVDPETHAPVPLEDGAVGEAVFTTLVGGGFGWTRLSLGDVHRVSVSPCPCGGTGLRFRVVGRTDDMLKVKGVIVYPAAVDAVVASFIPRVTGEFRIRLDEKPPRVVPPLKLAIERGAGVGDAELAALEADLLAAMKQRLKITPAVTWLEPGSLERSAHKTRFIEVAGS
jgi:phenylacetate-CoA ligase